MPTNYPTSLDDLSADNPAANDPVDGSSGAGGKPHHAQHDDLNSAVDALESTVGTTGAFNFALLHAPNIFTADNTFLAHAAVGPQSAVNGGSLSGADATWRIILDLEESFTVLNRGGETAGLGIYLEANPAGAASDLWRGIDLVMTTKAGNVQDFSSFAVEGVVVNVQHDASPTIQSLASLSFTATANGGDVGAMYGVDAAFDVESGAVGIGYTQRVLCYVYGGSMALAYGRFVQVAAFGAGSIGDGYADYTDAPSGYTGNYFGDWHADASGWGGTNAYYQWFDAPGVYRVKYDGVMAYYNPAFSPKYTPGGVDYERVVQQWNTNVLEYGLEAGGTGTLRKLRLLGTTVEVPGLLIPTGASNGYVWTSDVSGNGSWQPAAGGGGTVTAVSVASANGFAGTSSGGATPALTLTTSITGVLKGNGTAISASNVTDDAQTKAAVVPNTAPTAGQLLAGNAGGTAYAPVTLSGSGATISLASTGVMTISAIANASLANSSITIGGSSTALGGSVLGNVTNDTQTKAAIVPNTAPTAGQILAGNAGGTAYAPVSVSGDATLASTGAISLSTAIQRNVKFATAAAILTM